MSVSSYGDDTQSSGVVTRSQRIWMRPLEGKDVLIVEDIIDSGRTLYLSAGSSTREEAGEHASVHTAGQAGPDVCKMVDVDYAGFNDSGRICSRIWSGLCTEISESSVISVLWKV